MVSVSRLTDRATVGRLPGESEAARAPPGSKAPVIATDSSSEVVNRLVSVDLMRTSLSRTLSRRATLRDCLDACRRPVTHGTCQRCVRRDDWPQTPVPHAVQRPGVGPTRVARAGGD